MCWPYHCHVCVYDEALWGGVLSFGVYMALKKECACGHTLMSWYDNGSSTNTWTDYTCYHTCDTQTLCQCLKSLAATLLYMFVYIHTRLLITGDAGLNVFAWQGQSQRRGRGSTGPPYKKRCHKHLNNLTGSKAISSTAIEKYTF